MSEQAERAQRITDIIQTLALPGVPTGMRQNLEQELVTLQPLKPRPISGNVSVSDEARIDGVVVGVNLGRIVYGRDLQEDERRRLVWYLSGLSAKLTYLPLRGLEDRLDQGEGIALAQVYVMLATQSLVPSSLASEELFEDNDPRQPLKREYVSEWALPNKAILTIPMAMRGTTVITSEQANTLQSTQETTHVLARSLLATEAVYKNQHLVLLSDPGGGKSTFMRHLAWALAQRGLDQLSDATALFGWSNHQRLLPILLPLRKLAGGLARSGVCDTTVYSVLRDEMHTYCTGQIDELLIESLRRGKVLLLLDGLDELPQEDMTGVTDRRTTLRAVLSFLRLHPQVRVVITCRTRAFDKDLQALLNWHVETIAPFTLGQIRHFVSAWYCELVGRGHISSEQQKHLSQSLIDVIIANPKLQVMATTPLLLTMMALVLYTKGELPRDRHELYERILDLLLGQWDQVHNGQSLANAIGLPEWSSERFQLLLDQLAYKAHVDVSSQDGRGRLSRSLLRDDLCHFFEIAQVSQPWERARCCLDYFEQRSGLLAADDDQSYIFAHLTLQEHCAGRHLLRSKEAASLVMQHRTTDRWREPIFLGLGVTQRFNPTLIDRVLSDLIDCDEDGMPKSVERWQRDLILAAEIGVDRDWNYLRTQQVNVERHQRDLRRGLIAVLDNKSQPLPAIERTRAGLLLGDLGDPRYPITLDQWHIELARSAAGDTSGYFCRVETGTYIIGSTDNDPDADDDEKPQHTVAFDAPFLIARYPITNDQWKEWVQNGGWETCFANDSDHNHPNQPVVGVTWEMCNAFCGWLSVQLDVEIRLPTEVEWEAAARGGDARLYPWGNDWHDAYAATQQDQEMYRSHWSMPVGCYPAGMAPCGALDMAGNVYEWTSDPYRSYPGTEKPFTEERIVLRGGATHSSRAHVRCGARVHSRPLGEHVSGGFRVVVIRHLRY